MGLFKNLETMEAILKLLSFTVPVALAVAYDIIVQRRRLKVLEKEHEDWKKDQEEISKNIQQ